MISLGIIPSWQFDPNNPYNRNPNLVMPAGVDQTTVQPLGPTTYGIQGLQGLGITMVDPPLKRFVSSLSGGRVRGSGGRIGWKQPPHLRHSQMQGLGLLPDSWGWPQVGLIAVAGAGAWCLFKHFSKKKHRR